MIFKFEIKKTNMTKEYISLIVGINKLNKYNEIIFWSYEIAQVIKFVSQLVKFKMEKGTKSIISSIIFKLSYRPINTLCRYSF